MTERPNVLILHADQHRWDCLGAYGNPDVQSPHIDALAADGVRYENHFCSFPVCTPSRYSLLTGLYVHQHLGWTNRSTLPAGVDTLPRVLRETGYRTAAVGKMHFSPTYLDVGFEQMILAEQDGPGRYDDDYHRWLREEGLCDRVDLVDQVREYRQNAPQVYWDTVGALESDLDEDHHSTTWIADRALEEMESWEGGGHLLMVGFIKPHHPFDPPAPWSRVYDPDALSVLPGWVETCLPRDLAFHPGYFSHEGLTESQLRRVMGYYYATISQIDHHVGRMLSCLKRKGLYEDALIVYTSDHGDYLGFHHLLLKGNYMYDPLVKIPLIVKYPGQAGAGERSEALSSNIDLAPTLLRSAGCSVPAAMRGLDLLGCPEGREWVFAEAGRGRQYMARTQTRKLLLTRDQGPLFFDLERDPLELRDVSGNPAYRDEIEAHRQALAQWALFDSPSQVHLDRGAPVARGDNVPRADDGHVEQGMAYYRQEMDKPYTLSSQQWTSDRRRDCEGVGHV
jgi:arylsulfatase A-like enzyme